MTVSAAKRLPRWLPFVIGGLLVIQFAGLGTWQITRALEKQAARDAWGAADGFTPHHDGMDVRPYQRVRADGRFDAGHQFLLDNIIIESRIGAYVITPLETAADEPLLLVNRGWLPRNGMAIDESRLAIEADPVRVHGRIGSLPRAGYRMGTAVEDTSWPKTAVYPHIDDLAALLGRDVQPYVLLLDPESAYGFLRHWVPEEMGPARHYAYAFQWFAIALVLAGLLAWHARRGRSRE